MDNEQYINIKIKKLKDEAKNPTIHKDNRKVSDLYAAEDVYIAPNETVAVSTGLAFIFPDEIGMMIMPPNELHSKTSLRYAGGARVIENSYYFKEEVKIYFHNTYSLEENNQKVSEYKLINGTVVSDCNNLYDKGTVKICKGDCIAQIMPVTAAYNDPDNFKS